MQQHTGCTVGYALFTRGGFNWLGFLGVGTGRRRSLFPIETGADRRHEHGSLFHDVWRRPEIEHLTGS